MSKILRITMIDGKNTRTLYPPFKEEQIYDCKSLIVTEQMTFKELMELIK